MEKTSYAAGTPSWVDLGIPDAQGAREFYGSLFGWEFEVGPPETGHYTMVRQRGRNVAGLMQLSEEQQAEGVPPAWTTYLSTDDADDTAGRISRAGGQLLVAPMDVMEEGRLLVAADPSGAVFGCWQPRHHAGAQLVNEAGAVVWNECLSRDPVAARDFYVAVFGYGVETVDLEGAKYHMLSVGDRPIGGVGALPEMVPGDVPGFWLTYFGTADTDATASRARDLGGQVLVEPQDMPYGRFAVVSDPQGAVFAVVSVPQE